MSRWLAWCMNVVVVLALVGEGAHAHVASDSGHPCAVCAVGSTPAVAAVPEPALQAPESTDQVAAERPATLPIARVTSVHASRAPPRPAR